MGETAVTRKFPAVTDSASCPLSPQDLLTAAGPQLHELLLAEGQEWFRRLVDTMNEGMAIVDTEDRIQYANQRLCEMLHVDLDDVLGTDAKVFLANGEESKYALQHKKRMRGEAGRYEIRARNSLGEELHLLISPSPLYDAEGRFVGSFGLFLDLTTQKRVEDELDQERTLLRKLMEQVPDLVYVQDNQARFLMVSREQLQTLCARDYRDVIGKTDFDFFPHEIAETFYDNNMRVITTGQPMLNLLEHVQRRDGKSLWVLSSKVPLRGKDGEITGLLGVGRDVTHWQQFEKALADSEERFRLLLQHSRDVVYRLNLQTHKYEFVSQSIKDVLGYTQEDFLAMDARNMYNMVHPEDMDTFLEYGRQLLEAAREGRPAGLGEYRVRNKAGQMRWVNDSAAVLLNDDGEPIARIGAARDVTDNKIAERTLLAASRMEATTTLAGGIAHDFNNLMAAVLANAELLESSIGNNFEARHMLQVIQRSAEQAGDLAQQMLAYARGGKYQMQVVDLNGVIEEVLKLESHSLQPNVEVERRLDPQLRPVYADASQMGQIVMNLTINAAEAIGTRGKITIVSRNCDVDEDFVHLHPGLKPGRHVYLAVEDTGCGMSPEVMARVFEPFYSTKFQGRGLGLAAVYGIVKNHGGHISAYSEPGRGSIFKLYLPASDLFAETTRPVVQEVPTGHETILVVDDEEPLLEATQQMLNRLGYDVLLARNGKEALTILDESEAEVKLVLLDLAMPVLGGAETHAILAEKKPELRVIICSGYELDPAAQDILNRGACAFIQKPFRMQRLASEIRRALDN